MRTFCAGCTGLLQIFASGFSATAQEVVYLIRHCEKELSGTDPALTPEGRKRAKDWAEMLRHVDLDAIITSDALRTRETGAIIADAVGVQTSAVPRNDVAGLMDALQYDHDEDTVLVVSHAESIPRILENLGVLEDVTIVQSEFNNLYVVLGPWSDDPAYIHFLLP